MKTTAWVVGACVVLWVTYALILNHYDPYDPAAPSGNPKIDALTDTQRNCLGMYLKYGDVPASKLTMGQIRQIDSCQSLGFYHDLR